MQQAGGMKLTVKIPHVTWRDGRPRFNPGPGLRKLGFKGEDLKDAHGQWLTLEALPAWQQQLAARINAAKAAASPRAARRHARRIAPAYTIEHLFEDLFRSQRIRLAGQRDGLSPKTVADYRKKANAFASFDPQFWHAPAASISKPIVKGLHEALWEVKGLPMANGMIAVLRAAFSEALMRGRLRDNPALALRLKSAEPRARLGLPAEMDALLQAADDGGDHDIGDAIILALYTGQRQGDVLALEERIASGERINFIQSKTGARVRVPVLPLLMARLEQARARNALLRKSGETTAILDARTGRRFNEHTFRHRYADVRARAARQCASVHDFKFLDLRDTCVTRLSLAGCELGEIAAITGHSFETITGILKHYLTLTDAHAGAAGVKLKAWLEQEGIAI